MKIARIYLRVSTNDQDIERQRELIEKARNKGFYIAGVYEDKASGLDNKRPGLNKMIADLQAGDYLIIERLDRLTRLPYDEARKLIDSIFDKEVHIFVDGILDPSMYSDIDNKMQVIIFKALQDLLLNITLQMSYEDYQLRKERTKAGIALAKKQGKYKGRPKDSNLHKSIIDLRNKGISISQTASALKCSESTVFKVYKNYNKLNKDKLDDK